LTPNPIRKVLFTMAAHQVRALLMGGQACVFYGAAEFSRDTDLAILADAANWKRLMSALAELQAECVAVPPCAMEYLLRGHALHFRCHHPETEEMRVDVMSVMRGVDEFPKLWERRAAVADEDGAVYELLSLSDLVQAKKTQRKKDWPMIQRLIEADYIKNRDNPDEARLRFWLREMRTAELLLEICAAHPTLARELVPKRPLLALVFDGKRDELSDALDEEEKLEREKDRTYWQPLKAELEKLRHAQ
jgi:hypothetical protein